MFKLIEIRKIPNRTRYKASLKNSDAAISIGTSVAEVIDNIEQLGKYGGYTIIVYDASGAIQDIINEYGE